MQLGMTPKLAGGCVCAGTASCCPLPACYDGSEDRAAMTAAQLAESQGLLRRAAETADHQRTCLRLTL